MRSFNLASSRMNFKTTTASSAEDLIIFASLFSTCKLLAFTPLCQKEEITFDNVLIFHFSLMLCVSYTIWARSIFLCKDLSRELNFSVLHTSDGLLLSTLLDGR